MLTADPGGTGQLENASCWLVSSLYEKTKQKKKVEMWIVFFWGITKTRYQPTNFRVFQCFSKIFMLFYLGELLQLWFTPDILNHPLVNVHKKLWKGPLFLMGKSTINSNCPQLFLCLSGRVVRWAYELQATEPKSRLDKKVTTLGSHRENN